MNLEELCRAAIPDLEPGLSLVERDVHERLRRVRDDPARGGGMDGELARLLNLTAALEYTNDDRWYRVHPLAEFLLENAGAGT